MGRKIIDGEKLTKLIADMIEHWSKLEKDKTAEKDILRIEGKIAAYKEVLSDIVSGEFDYRE